MLIDVSNPMTALPGSVTPATTSPLPDPSGSGGSSELMKSDVNTGPTTTSPYPLLAQS